MSNIETEKFLLDIRSILSRISKNSSIYSLGEEATKTSLVLPFFSALGYDIFDVDHVFPEFTADVGVKNGEKVDYALMFDGLPRIIVECKKLYSIDNERSFNDGYSQLFRYFSVTDCHAAILTDGDTYMIFSDTKEKNIMDEKPIIKFRISDILNNANILYLSMRLRRNDFSREDLIRNCSGINLYSHVQSRLTAEIENPSDALCRLFMQDSHDGRLTATIIDSNRHIIRDAIKSFILNEDSSSSAIFDNLDTNNNDAIVTTQEELEAFAAIKTIAGVYNIDPQCLEMRDAKSYCTIFQHYANKPKVVLMRLFFDKRNKYFELNDGTKYQIETDFISTITSADVLYSIKERLLQGET